MGIIMQLLIDHANFRTTPGRENDWQGREQTRDTQSHPEPFVNHGVKFSSQGKRSRARGLAKTRANKNGRDRLRYPAQET